MSEMSKSQENLPLLKDLPATARCGYCAHPFTETPVACVGCGALACPGCWEENNGCTQFGCSSPVAESALVPAEKRKVIGTYVRELYAPLEALLGDTTLYAEQTACNAMQQLAQSKPTEAPKMLRQMQTELTVLRKQYQEKVDAALADYTRMGEIPAGKSLAEILAEEKDAVLARGLGHNGVKEFLVDYLLDLQDALDMYNRVNVVDAHQQALDAAYNRVNCIGLFAFIMGASALASYYFQAPSVALNIFLHSLQCVSVLGILGSASGLAVLLDSTPFPPFTQKLAYDRAEALAPLLEKKIRIVYDKTDNPLPVPLLSGGEKGDK